MSNPRLLVPAVLVAGIGLFAAGGLSAAPAPASPEAERVVAFRGYSAVAPENTLAAIRAAAAADVPRVWAEVRLTADGVPVLLADPTLDRTTGCTGPVKDQPAASVAACDAGAWFGPAFAGERVPRLSEALAEAAVSYQLLLAGAAPDAVLGAVRAAGALGRVTFVSESEADIEALLAAEPGARAWLRVPGLSGRAIGQAVAIGAAGLAVDPGPLPAADLADAADAGLALGVVAVPDERTLATVLQQGVASASIDRVAPAVAALSLAFRSYLPADLGRPAKAEQGFVRTLATGDFNADGKVDLALGAPLDDTTAESAGWVGVTFGAERFPGPVQGQPGTEADGQWGSVLAAADFNGDRFDDLAIGYPQRDFNGTDSGAVWLWDGSASGVGALSRPIGSQSPTGSHMGAALATLDYNGDGVPDLAIASPDRAVTNVAGSGQVTLMPGLPGSGPVATGALILDRTTSQMDPDIVVPGDPVRNEHLGAALAAGDFDGDGLDDLAVGVPGADAGAERGVGSVLVTFGAATDTTGAPALREVVELTRASAGVPGEPERASNFGAALLSADFDGDGFDDLVVAAPDATVSGRRGAGELVLLYGAADGLDPSRSLVINQDSPALPGESAARNRFGAYLAAGDLDGDGDADLVVGTPEETVATLPGVGAVTALYGSAEGLDPRVAMQLAPAAAFTGFPPETHQAFGRALAVADLNRDGAADLAIGTLGYTAGGVSDLGALVVAWGPSADLPGVATPTPPPPTQTPLPTLTRTPRPSRTPTPSLTPTITPTPAPSATPRPVTPVYLPFAARLKRFSGR